MTAPMHTAKKVCKGTKRTARTQYARAEIYELFLKNLRIVSYFLRYADVLSKQEVSKTRNPRRGRSNRHRKRSFRSFSGT